MKFYTSVGTDRNNILLRGYENGKRVHRKIPYNPYVFVPTNATSEYKTLEGKPVEKLPLGSLSDAREFINMYKDVPTFKYYGLTRWEYVFINDEYSGDIDYDTKQIKTCYIDIETDSRGGFPDIATANKAILSVTMYVDGTYYLWAMKDFVPHMDNIVFYKFDSEEKMLESVVRRWRELDFDIVTGWNSDGFDIIFLYNRIERLFDQATANKLSPWGRARKRSYFNKIGREQHVVDLEGLASLDYLELYMKFTYSKQEQYSLDYISEIELGEKKVDYRELGYSDLNDLYERNPQLFLEYNVKDVYLVKKLDDKLKFIDQASAIAYDAKVNYSDALTSVLLWDVIIHNYLMSKNTVIPQSGGSRKEKQIAGAYVKDPDVGRYDWVVSFDLNSLYPHLIMMYNISPETFVERIPGITPDSILNDTESWRYHITKAKEQNMCIAGSGSVFKKDSHGFLPELMKRYYDDRKKFKKMMIQCKQQLQEDKDNEELKRKVVQYDNMQMAKKISLNSAYGALSNQYFRFYNDDLAEAITLSGQVSILWAMKKVNQYISKITGKEGEYVIASDTDSLYVELKDLVNKFCADKTTKQKVDFLDRVCEDRIQPYIDGFYQELADKVNAYEQAMQMKREAISEAAIWTGAKRYIMSVWNNEGVAYDPPYFKMTGIEAVRSSTPTVCRGAIEEAARIILNSDQEELYEYIEKFKAEFYSADIASIARNSSVKDIVKYSNATKGIPMHVNGALTYNRMLAEKGLTNKYPKITDGDKIKFVTLRLPNPSRSAVVAFPNGYLPTEFNLHDYVNKDEHLEVGFMNPIRTIATAAGKKVDKISTLEDFFS